MHSLSTIDTALAPIGADARQWASLLKPRVMSLVVFTGAAGMWLASGELHPFLQAITILCIALGSGAGGMINMWYDRDIDAVMRRTQQRPLPLGLVAADDVLTFGLFLAVFSVLLLGLATNWLAGFTLAFAIFFYAVIYTMLLKRSTSQNIVIGGAAGAFPPLIGWVAVTGELALIPLILFAIIFLWTPPHFWALALYRNEDYRAARIPMLPVTHGPAYTKKLMELYCWLLLPVTLLPVALGFSGWIYGVIALGLGVRFIQHSRRQYHAADFTPARQMFGFSIVYLFAMFGALLADSILMPLSAGISF